MTTIILSVYNNLSPSTPVDNVTVRIYSESGDSFITQLSTGADGQVTYDVPDATYWVRFYKKGFSFASKTLIVVDSAEINIWDIQANDLTELPPSRAEGICRVSGFIVDAQGSPSHLPIVTFGLPQDTRVFGTSIIGTEKVIAQPDSNGYVEVELLQNAIYAVTMASISDEVVKVRVPNSQACLLTNLVYPTGKLSSTPGAINVTVNLKYQTGIFVQSTSGVTIPDVDIGLLAPEMVDIATSSNKIICVVDNNQLVITASEVGTHTVSISQKMPKGVKATSSVLLGTFTVNASA